MANEISNEWIEHDGGKMPVDADTLVLTRRGVPGSGRYDEDRPHDPETAGWWDGDGSPGASNWLHAGTDADILAYRVVSA